MFPRRPAGIVALGHGAGGSFDADDLQLATELALARGLGVIHFVQPYRRAGRRAPAPAASLDVAFTEVIGQLHARRRIPLIVGGRSSGARVAVRCAFTLRATGVLALAFPLHPPSKPERSRAGELAACPVPVRIIQGVRDPFGAAHEFDPAVQVTTVPGTHTLRRTPELAAALGQALDDLVSRRALAR